jgi:hypothetical protein
MAYKPKKKNRAKLGDRNLPSIPVDRWKKAKSDSQKRIVWIEFVNSIWDKEKDNPKVRDNLEQHFFRCLTTLGYSEKQVGVIRRLKEHQRPVSLLNIGYLINNGISYKPSVDYLRKSVNDLLAKNVEVPQLRLVKKPVEVVCKYAAHIERLEQLEDNKLTELPDFRTVISEMNLDAAGKAKIISVFQPRFDEYKLALKGDAKILEGYNYSKRQFSKICKWYAALFEQLEAVKVTKKPRTIRKSRPKSPAKIAKMCKYLAFDKETKMNSAKPDEVVGAKAVVCYCPKKRTMYFYSGADRLSIRRSSIVDFDEKTSFQKKLRRPLEQLTAICGSGRLSAISAATKIKAKTKPCTGRMSAEILIVSVFNK